MFELTVALRYLLPRKRSLSTALVSLLSVGVIALVVWLVLVFLSVTTGIEKNWLSKLTSLYAPVRITPTERYYDSYYYRIDALASASGFGIKTIGEKAQAPVSDPYSENEDRELPPYLSTADRKSDGQLIDPVKELYAALSPLTFQDYEIAGALLKLSVERPIEGGAATLSQMSYLLSLTEKNPRLASLLLEPTQEEAAKHHVQIHFDKAPDKLPAWAIEVGGHLVLPDLGPGLYPVLLPKNYRDLGVKLFTRGTLTFAGASAASSQEQRLNVQVVGFYDPGLFSLGGRCIIAPSSATRIIHSTSQTFSPDGTPTNGLLVWGSSASDVESRLQKANLSSWWKVSSYQDYEFSKDLFLQFRSDRTLFLLIAAIILIVACCNVISLLVLLVNDKKKEIAILQAMGAKPSSIALIFGTCGFAMGMISSLVGTAAAIFTLHHLESLTNFLSALQGHAAFQPAFFGKTLPNELSPTALAFVFIVTPLLSLFAGLVPALRSSQLKPSTTLRQE